METCPKAYAEPPFDGHRFRLEKSLGHRELWRCVLCGLNKVESLRLRCDCGGAVNEDAPWWCQNKENHK